jgi:hypothetical protein
MAEDFSIQMERIITKTVDKAEKSIRKAILDTYGEIILTSPVDTGLFRSNNQLSLGSPKTGVVHAEHPVKGTSYPPPTDGGAVLSSYKLNVIAYISNNLRYARPIEFGWSKQAPNGCYRKAAMKFGTFLNNALGE